MKNQLVPINWYEYIKQIILKLSIYVSEQAFLCIIKVTSKEK